VKATVYACLLAALVLFSRMGTASGQKITIDANRHIHYGPLSAPAAFPIVLYDFNSNLCSNPANELSLVSQLSVDTVVDVVCDSASSAQMIANAMKPLGLHLWSTVPWGVGYSGGDPGFVNELSTMTNVTGYFVTDEPQTLSDMSAVNSLNNTLAAIDPTALRVTSFNDATFGGAFPNYGGGPFDLYNGNEITMDVLGNGPWNDRLPRSSNGLYDVTWETRVWDSQANSIFPNIPLITDIAYYGPPGNTTGDANCYLTLPQTLSEAWAAVVNNTDGLAWWAIGQGETGGADMCDGSTFTYAQVWDLLVKATATVHNIQDVILSPVRGWYTHSEPESVIQTNGRANWIFASNITENPVTDTFSGLTAGMTVTAYAGNADGTDRTVCTNCGTRFTDTLPGFTAYAYKVSSASTPTPTPSPTPTVMSTPTPTSTPIPTPSSTPTVMPTATPTQRHHGRPTPTPRTGSRRHGSQ
jgi:hypothetical protein